LDPAFTTAVYDLAAAYRNAGNEARAREMLTRAFALRQRASFRKRLAIEGLYYSFVTINLDKAMASYKDCVAREKARPKADVRKTAECPRLQCQMLSRSKDQGAGAAKVIPSGRLNRQLPSQTDCARLRQARARSPRSLCD
jgi:hypothetical protein